MLIQDPVAIGLTGCEQIIVEENTHNITLVNCLTRLRVREIPSEPHRLVFYARLTDGIGDGKICLEILRPDNLDLFLRREISVKFTDPLRELRAVFRGALSFPVEGRYQVNLWVDGTSIARRTLHVSLRREIS